MVQLRGGRSRGGPSRQRGPRRATSWFLEASVADNVVTPGSLVNFEMAVDLASDERKGATVTRIRGEMVIWSTVANGLAATVQAIWFAGMILGHENLLTTVPDPELDDADWMWYQTGYVVPGLQENDAGSATTHQFNPPRYITLDNRSQRKMLSQEARLLFVFKNDTSSDFDVQVGIAARVLIKHRG